MHCCLISKARVKPTILTLDTLIQLQKRLVALSKFTGVYRFKKIFLTIFTSLTRKSSWTQATISKVRETSLTGSFITARVTGTSILTSTKAVFKKEIKKRLISKISAEQKTVPPV